MDTQWAQHRVHPDPICKSIWSYKLDLVDKGRQPEKLPLLILNAVRIHPVVIWHQRCHVWFQYIQCRQQKTDPILQFIKSTLWGAMSGNSIIFFRYCLRTIIYLYFTLTYVIIITKRPLIQKWIIWLHESTYPSMCSKKRCLSAQMNNFAYFQAPWLVPLQQACPNKWNKTPLIRNRFYSVICEKIQITLLHSESVDNKI